MAPSFSLLVAKNIQLSVTENIQSSLTENNDLRTHGSCKVANAIQKIELQCMPNFRVTTKHVTFTRRLPGCRIPNLTMHPCMREQPSRYKATDGFLDASQVDRRRDARKWRCSMDFWIQFPWTPTKLTSVIFTLLALPAAWPSSSSPARLWSATPSSSLYGSAPPRPTPVSAPCPSADTLLALPLPRCRRRLLVARPSCVAGEDEGTQKTASIFGAILSPRGCNWIRTASTQGDSIQRKSCRRVRLEHEPSLSSHDATTSFFV